MSTIDLSFLLFSNKILEFLPSVVLCLQHPYCAVRHLGARCLGVLSTVATEEVMRTVVMTVLPLMGGNIVVTRQGVVESIYRILVK